MTTHWEKQLRKAADLIFELPPGHSFWPESMFEPLTVAICFPFIKHRPWQLRLTPAFLRVESQLRGLLKADICTKGPFLRKLWGFTRELDTMPKRLGWKLLQGERLNRLSSCTSRKRRRPGVEEEEG